MQKKPNEYSKRLLLAVSGMSPQILTETLYAIAIAEKEIPFIPTEIHLISTLEGARRANLELLHPQTGKFHQLCADYGLTAIEFNEHNIYTIEDKAGTPLNDIKTPEDNEAAADFITNIVNKLTNDNETALHVSIAGGRKTMGYYLGYALSLYGRVQDRLSHVLISENYEGLQDFFYPTPESHVIYDRNHNPLDTQKAQVMLAQIPFVQLRNGIPSHLLGGKIGFSESIALARSFENKPRLQIDKKARCVYANSVKVKMTNVNFSFYLWMIEQTVYKKQVIKRPYDLDAKNLKPATNNYVDDFLKIYKSHSTEGEWEKVSKMDKDGMSKLWISERITAVKKAFENVLESSAANFYCVQSEGNNSNRSYKINLEEDQIEIL
jgi:CRISPR-associated protein (TIGR02584 family)